MGALVGERASSAMNEALGVATVLCLRSPGLAAVSSTVRRGLRGLTRRLARLLRWSVSLRTKSGPVQDAVSPGQTG
jgi:hypothetical protein